MRMSNLLQQVEDKLFGKKKPMSQEPVQQAQSQSPAQAPATPPASVPEEKENKEEVQAKPAEDRSAFNCPDCGGEGLKDQYSVCPRCQGTGKV